MAGKITELATLTATAASYNDVLEIVDLSDVTMATSGTNKRFSLNELWLWMLPRYLIEYSAAATTASLDQAGGYLRFTNAAPTFTIPPHSSVPFKMGTQIDGIGTAGAMTIVAGAGVTLVKARTLVTVGPGSGWTIVKIYADQWDVHGDFV